MSSQMVGLILLGFVLAIPVVWGWTKAKARYRRWRYGDEVSHQELMSSFSHQMVNRIEDREAITTLFSQEIPQAIGVSRATALFTTQKSANEKMLGDASDLQLPFYNAAIRRVTAGGQAVRVEGELKRIVAQGRTDLNWTRVWVPLLRGTNLYGLWLLGERANLQDFSSIHLEWLTTFAKQAAMILEAVEHAQNEQFIAREMQKLYHQAVRAREVERAHLSRELHDGVLQDLCTIARDLKALAKTETETSETLIACANESIQTLRTICYDLRPPFLENNLLSAIKVLCERIEEYASAPISVETTIESLTLPDETTLAIYRIVQEALNNAAEYADASEITVRLIKYPDELRITISDDGKGIEHNNNLAHYVTQGHLGLAGMRERAKMIGASLAFHSVSDYGTVITLDIPTQNIVT